MTTVTVTGSRSSWMDESGSAGDFSRPEPEGQPGSNEPGPGSAPDQPYFAPPVPPSIILEPVLVTAQPVLVPLIPLAPAFVVLGALTEILILGFQQAQDRLLEYFDPIIPRPDLTAPDFVDLVLPADPVRQLPEPEPQPMVEIVVRPGVGTPLRDPRDFPFELQPAIGVPYFDPVPQSPPIFQTIPQIPTRIAPDFQDFPQIFPEFLPNFPNFPQIFPEIPEILEIPAPISLPAPPRAPPAPPQIFPNFPEIFEIPPKFLEIPPQIFPNFPGFSAPIPRNLTANNPLELQYPYNQLARKDPKVDKKQDQCEEDRRPPCEVGYYRTNSKGTVTFQRWGFRKSGCKPNARNAS